MPGYTGARRLGKALKIEEKLIRSQWGRFLGTELMPNILGASQNVGNSILSLDSQLFHPGFEGCGFNSKDSGGPVIAANLPASRL